MPYPAASTSDSYIWHNFHLSVLASRLMFKERSSNYVWERKVADGVGDARDGMNGNA